MSELDLEQARETARLAVEAAGKAALRYFKTGVAVETKLDRSPVTAADKEAEAAAVSVIQSRHPGHALLTEESGVLGASSPYRWIVDPLDGTRGFIRGGSFWGPLVALEANGRIVAGAMTLPVLGETYTAARGLGCHRGSTRCQVSAMSDLSESTLSLGEMRGLFHPSHKAGVDAVVLRAASTRCYGDLAGCAMVLDGKAEVWLEAGVKVWDLAPLMILIEEAGGRFTDMSGQPTVETGDAIASNGRVHDEVLAALRA